MSLLLMIVLTAVVAFVCGCNPAVAAEKCPASAASPQEQQWYCEGWALSERPSFCPPGGVYGDLTERQYQICSGYSASGRDDKKLEQACRDPWSVVCLVTGSEVKNFRLTDITADNGQIYAVAQAPPIIGGLRNQFPNRVTVFAIEGDEYNPSRTLTLDFMCDPGHHYRDVTHWTVEYAPPNSVVGGIERLVCGH
jgi:hypothetical protein